jgi:hypothetical protein
MQTPILIFSLFSFGMRIDQQARLKIQSKAASYPVPNWAVKRTPTLAMASPSSWPVLVPCAPSVLRRRLPW